MRRFDADARIEAALGLLAALTTAPGRALSERELLTRLALTEHQLDEVIDTVATLSDRQSGARVIIQREQGSVLLRGTAGTLRPLRLTSEEARALRQVIDRCRFAPDIRKRLALALMPGDADEAGAAATLSADPIFGSFYQLLLEAIIDGVRCRISYRAVREQAPSTRTVDPARIEAEGGAAYLIAWDVEKDAQRRYRMDRIAHAALTEDSVERHPFRYRSVTESLQDSGKRVVLSFRSKTLLDHSAWTGLRCLGETDDSADGPVTAEVSYASESWLLDQVLAAGGDILIVEPPELRERLAERGRALLSERDGAQRP